VGVAAGATAGPADRMRRDRQEAPLTRWPRLGQPGTRKLGARRPDTHVRMSLVDLQPLRAFATKPGQPGPVQVTTLRTSSVTCYYVTDTSAGSVSAGSRCGQRSSRLGEVAGLGRRADARRGSTSIRTCRTPE